MKLVINKRAGSVFFIFNDIFVFKSLEKLTLAVQYSIEDLESLILELLLFEGFSAHFDLAVLNQCQ
jgi:hypothetical protein